MKIPKFDLDLNCPHCGLTKLVDFYCVTCDKHVIFKNRSEERMPVLEVTDEIIYVLDY